MVESPFASAKKRLSDAASRLLAGDRTAIAEADQATAEIKEHRAEQRSGSESTTRAREE